MKNNNSDTILISLLNDDLFLQWVIEPTPELDRFWMRKMADNEWLKESICDLRHIITELNIEEPILSADDKKLIWKNIKQTTENTKGLKKKYRLTGIWAAAVVFIGLLAVAYIYFNSNKQPDIDYQSIIDNVQVPQSDHISLILADNKVVDIQEDSSNVIYDHTGKIKIDKETIESTGNEKPTTLNQLIVPYGKTTSLTLSDGTKIWVNSGTKLIYPSIFDKNKREIFCTGEIYLDVASRDNCPFIVKTDHIDINVKGTQFNVSAYKDEAIQSIVLVSGSVSIKGRMLDGTYDMSPNQMLSYETGSNQADVQEVDVSNYISWIHGYLFLRNERIDHVLQKLEKYYNVSFTYKGVGFDKIYVRGKLDLTGSLENALNYISITTSVNYAVNNENIEIIN